MNFVLTCIPLSGDKKQERQELSWYVSTLSHLDPHTAQYDNEVRRILNLQNVTDSMTDMVSDIAKLMRSHSLAANMPFNVENP